MVVAFVLRYALDASLLDVQFACEPLHLRIQARPILKRLTGNGAVCRRPNSYRLLLDVELVSAHLGALQEGEERNGGGCVYASYRDLVSEVSDMSKPASTNVWVVEKGCGREV